ncbi:MAG TPA: S8 family serine peptidase, partial [Candidatus Binatia bacterium]|nr:S8 family serine peptidase [Candidatus Binatia bacterium]
MSPLEMVKLTTLMQRTSGRAEIVIGLIDGPIAINHPYLMSDNIHEIPGSLPGMCLQASSTACQHGTFVAAILSARRSSPAPAICPDCTLLVRPIFTEATPGNGQMPSATPEDLAAAIVETVNAGAHVLNLSVALVQSLSKGERELEEAL